MISPFQKVYYICRKLLPAVIGDIPECILMKTKGIFCGTEDVLTHITGGAPKAEITIKTLYSQEPQKAIEPPKRFSVPSFLLSRRTWMKVG